MLDKKQVTLLDKDIFDSYFNRYKPQISELTFTNLFAWRHHYKLEYAIIEDYLCILAKDDNDRPYMFPPVGNLENSKLEDMFKIVKEYFKSSNQEFRLKKVCEQDLGRILDILGLDYVAQYDRDNSDYIYLASDLCNLKGNRYHKKRNHVNKFMSTYQYEYIPINQANKDICYTILDRWISNKEDKFKSYQDEITAIREILENLDKLDCKGAIIKVDGEPQAFSIGEKLNSNTAVIHMEKINPRIYGLGEFTNKEFCNQNFKDMTYINREQDLGIEGLRKAKKSYCPQRLINKYNVKCVK